MCNLETSIDTKIVSLLIFVISCILNVGLLFCAIGSSNVSTKEDILSVRQSQPEMIGLLTGIGLWIFVSV